MPRVGSSKISTSQSRRIHLEMTTFCWLPPERLPTRGIDVGAKSEIYKLMTQLAEEGKSIIMISSDMPELLRLSDRVIVMCEGHVTGELDISEATQETIMTYATKREVG